MFDFVKLDRNVDLQIDSQCLQVEDKSIIDMIYNSIMCCPIETRRDIFCNIILSGGNTMLDSFPDRLKYKFDQHILPNHGKRMKTKIVAAPERLFSAWIGGSILASLSTFQNMWITKEDFVENGERINDKLIV